MLFCFLPFSCVYFCAFMLYLASLTGLPGGNVLISFIFDVFMSIFVHMLFLPSQHIFYSAVFLRFCCSLRFLLFFLLQHKHRERSTKFPSHLHYCVFFVTRLPWHFCAFALFPIFSNFFELFSCVGGFGSRFLDSYPSTHIGDHLCKFLCNLVHNFFLSMLRCLYFWLVLAFLHMCAFSKRKRGLLQHTERL